jgi:hypothetical protein
MQFLNLNVRKKFLEEFLTYIISFGCSDYILTLAGVILITVLLNSPFLTIISANRPTDCH